MLTLVDAIRLITHALKSLIRRGYVDFSDFQKEKELMAGKMISSISELRREQLEGKTASILEKSKGDAFYDSLTWRGLLIKLELEAQLLALPSNPDFKALYDTLDKVGEEVESLMVPVL